MSQFNLDLNEARKEFPSIVESRRDPLRLVYRLFERSMDCLSSRRDAMRILVGASASIPLWGPLARAASAFTFDADNQNARFLLNGIPLFHLRTDVFDGSPKLLVREGDGSFSVRLVKAFFPGTDLPADFTLAGTRTTMGWEARLRVASMGFDASFPFEQWLIGQPVARSPISFPADLRTDEGTTVAVSKATDAVLYPDWTFQLAGSDVARMTSVVGAISGHETQIEVIPPEESPLLLEGRRRPQLRIWVKGQAHSLTPIDLEPVQASFSEGKMSVLVELQRSQDGKVFSASSFEAKSQGGAVGQVTVGGIHSETVVQAHQLCVTKTGACKEEKVTVVADLVQNCAWVSKGRIQAELVLAENGEPFRVEKQSGCECKVPRGVRVARIVAPLPGVEQAMFVRRGLKLSAGKYLPGSVVKDDELDEIKWLTDFSFGTPKIPLRSLDLLLRRGRDGFVVTVRFKDVYLDSIWSSLFLIGNGSDPLVEFDLGPQHVQEEALYVTDLAKCQESQNSSTPQCPEPAPEDLITLSDEELYYWLGKMVFGGYVWPSNFPEPRTWSRTPEDFVKEIKRIDCEKFREVKKEAIKRYVAQQSSECINSEPCIQAKSRFSEPTWLTFKLAGLDKQIPFEVDALFDWTFYSKEVRDQSKGHFECAFPNLAISGTASLADQRALRTRLGLRPRSLREPSEVVPTQDKCPNLVGTPEPIKTEFASLIHAPYRLGLSPIDQVLWKAPSVKRLASSSRVDLWHVKAEKIQLRAVWSPDFAAENFFANEFRHWPGNPGGGANFRGSLDARDRHEIVALTAGFGQLAKRGSDQVVSNPDDVANSEEGIFVPKPVDAKLVILTSFGATLDICGTWAPPSSSPAIQPSSGCKPGALTVERWDHRSQIGRDTKVVVEYKGFLFPLGHPCTLVKETERRLVTVKRKGKDCVVARLVQRFFIKVPSFIRAFSVPGQPFQGRAWPFTRVETEKFVSPDLAKPENYSIVAGLGQQAFWPKLASDCSKYVDFPFYDEATNVRMSAPLVFVDNEIVHDPKSLLDVIRCYRRLVEKSRNELAAPISQRADWKSVLVNPEHERTPTPCVVRVHGGTIAYAEANGVGDTKYQTRRFLLDVDVPQPKCRQSSLRTQDSCNQEMCGDSGEVILTLDEEEAGSIQSTLVMSVSMEAASQPPFFPHLRQALIEPGQLALLSGQQHGENVVEFDAVYLRHGFASSQNAGEVILRFVDGGVRLSFSNNTAASGGVANPSTQIVAISRKRGPIGGNAIGCVPQGESYRYEVLKRVLTIGENPQDGDNVAIDRKLYTFQSALTNIDGHVLIGATAEKTAKNLVAAINCTVTPNPSYAAATVRHPTCCAELQTQPPKVLIKTIVSNLQGQGVDAKFANKQANTWSGTDLMLAATSAVQSEFSDPCAAARQDMMKPMEFFAQVLGDAKLFGCVRLVDILAVSLQASGATMPQIRDGLIPGVPPGAIQDIAQRVRKLMSVESEIGKAMGNFPCLRPVVIQLDNALEALSRASNVGGDNSLPLAEGIAVLKASRAFEEAFRTTVNDPRLLLPSDARTFLKSVDDLRGAFESTFASSEIKKLTEEIRTQLIEDIQREMQQIKKELLAHRRLGEMARYVQVGTEELQAFEREIRGAADSVFYHVGNRIQALLRHTDDFGNWAEWLNAQPAEHCTYFVDFLVRLSKLNDEDWIKNKIKSPVDKLSDDIDAAKKKIENLRAKLSKSDTDQNVRQQLDQVFVALSDASLSLQGNIAQIKRGVSGLEKTRDALRSLCDLPGRNISVDEAKDLGKNLAFLENVLATLIDMVGRTPQLSQLTQPIIAKNFTEATDLTKLNALLIDLKGTISNVVKAFATNPALEDALTKLSGTLESIIATKCAPSAETQISCNAARWLAPQVVEAQELLRKLKDPRTDLEQIAVAAGYCDGLQRLQSVVFAALTLEGRARREAHDVASNLRQHIEGRVFRVATSVSSVLSPITVKLQQAVSALTNDSVKAWLAEPLRNRIFDLSKAVEKLKQPQSQTSSELRSYFGAIQDVGVHLSGLVRELSQVVSSGDIGALINARTFVDQVMAELAFPMRARLTYDWDTEVHAYPGGAGSIFEPVQDQGRRLTIKAITEVVLGTDTSPTSFVEATLDPFKINLFDCLTIKFRKLTFTAGSGRKAHCDVGVTGVEFAGGLNFVRSLQDWIKEKTGLLVGPWEDGPGIVVTYGFNEEVITLPKGNPTPSFVLQNVGLSISCILPFNDAPVRFRFALADPHKPFLLSVGIYGGGGFVAIQSRADTIERLELSFEYGLVTAFTFGPAKGTGRITAGIYIRLENKASKVEGFFIACGNADVAGLISLDVVFRIGITYSPNTGKAEGDAIFRICFRIGFLKYGYDVKVAYAKDGEKPKEEVASGQDSGRALLTNGSERTYVNKSIEGESASVSASSDEPAIDYSLCLIKPEVWKQYWQAYASPLTSCREWAVRLPTKKVAAVLAGPEALCTNAAGMDEVGGNICKDSILNGFQWMVIPHGRNPLTGCLRLTIRIVPQLGSKAFGEYTTSSKKRVRDLATAVSPVGIGAIQDWPGFVDEQLRAITICVGSAPPIRVEQCDIQNALQQGRERHCISKGFPSRAWRSIVTENLPVKPYDDDSTKLSLNEEDRKDGYLAAMPHSKGAELVRHTYGGIYATALAKKEATNGSRRKSVDENKVSFLVEKFSIGVEEGKHLAGLSSIFGGTASVDEEVTGKRNLFREGTNEEASKAWTDQRFAGSYDDAPDAIRLSKKGRKLYKERKGRLLLRETVSYDEELPSEPNDLGRFAIDRLIYISPETKASLDPQQFALANKDSSIENGCHAEFHQEIGKLVFHPWLLESLGLVVDIELSKDILLSAGEGTIPIWISDVLVGNSKTGQLISIQPEVMTQVMMLNERQGDARNWFPAEGGSNATSCETGGSSEARDVGPQLFSGCVLLDKQVCVNVPRETSETESDKSDNASSEESTLKEVLKPEYTLEQIDIDFGLSKLTQAAVSYSTLFDAGVPVEQRFTECASVPTTGISLLMRRPSEKQKKVNDNLDNRYKAADASKTPLKLYAEDLVIGYRPDIQALPIGRNGAFVSDSWKSLTGKLLKTVNLSGSDGGDIRVVSGGMVVSEGLVMLPMRTNPNSKNGSKRVLQYGEELFRWQGWSLGVPPLECTERSDREESLSNCPIREPLNITYQCAGGLPKLRIGWGYRVGLRAVFADGRSISLEEAAEVYASMPSCTIGTSSLGRVWPSDPQEDHYLPFFRNELVASPDVLLRERLQQGRMTGEGRTRLLVGSTGMGMPVAPSTSRVLVPPRVDLEMAIRLGVYDDAALRAKSPQSAFAGVRLNKNGSFPGNRSLLENKDSLDSSDGGIYFETSSLACAPEVPYLPDPWAKRMIIGIFRKADNQLLGIDYFDCYDDDQHKWPNCRHLDLRVKAVLSDVPPLGFKVSWSDSALTIEVSPGYELVVRCWFEMKEEMLGKAGTVEHMARYLSTSDGAVLRNVLKLPDRCEGNPEDVRACLIQRLSHWHERLPVKLHSFMTSNKPVEDVVLTSFECLNPAVELDVIHAVQVPTQVPECVHAQDLSSKGIASAPVRNSAFVEEFDLQRLYPGDTRAIFTGDIAFNRQSTSQVTCLGQWVWKNDEVGSKFRVDPPKPASHLMFSLGAISAPLPGALSNPHLVSGKPTPELPIDNNLILLSGCRKSIGRHKNEDLDMCCSQQGNVEQKKLEFEFQDTKAKLVRFTLQAVSRSGDLFFKEPTPSSVRQSELVTERWVKSSWPPKPPEVAYLHPLFDWREESGKTAFTRTRVGGWFRIWLDRPWFSSGDGELLALVCWPPTLFDPPGGSSTYAANEQRMLLGRAWDRICDDLKCLNPKRPDARLESLYTGWGLDPIWEQSKARLSYIPAEAFTNRFIEHPVTVVPSQFIDWSKVNMRDGLPGGYTLPNDQLKKLKVALALYEPKYDEAEQRWFVDVHLEPPKESYNPFVRLALARYQPNSLPGCELSEIRTAQFIQLTPSRAASVLVSREGNDKVAVQIRVTGVSAQVPDVCLPQEAANKERRSHVVVRLERRKRGLFSGTGAEGDDFKNLYDCDSDEPWVPFQRGVLGDDESLPECEGLYPGEVLLQYKQSSDSQSWSGTLAFTVVGRYEYSLYLEERESILQDKEPHKGGIVDPGRLGHRVVYVDRIRIML